MEQAKKRRRRLLLLIVVVAVVFWVAGCATGRTMSLGLGAIVPSVDKGGETLQGGSAPGMTGGSDRENQGGTLTGVGGNGGDGQPSAGTGVGDGSSSGQGSSSNGGTGTGGTPAGGEEGNAGGGTAGGTPGGTQGNAGGGTQGNGGGGAAGGTQGNAGGGTTGEQGNNSSSGDGKKLAALTFDDGPDSKYTTAILDILKDKGVKATFFVVGQQVTKYPEVLQRIADEGHAIGNHTQNHKDLKKQSKAGILEQINLTDNAIDKVLGEKPTLFRAPYGSLSDTVKQTLKAQGREHTGWTVDTRDWAGTSIADMRDMIRKETKPNGIILMHSFGGKHIKNTVEALPDMIDDLHKLGYTLVTVDKLP